MIKRSFILVFLHLFFLSNVLILFLVFAIERKIVLVENVCSKYFIIIKFHDFHAALKGEITSFSLFIGFYRLHVFWPFFCFP